jgi:hypothetical protein
MIRMSKKDLAIIVAIIIVLVIAISSVITANSSNVATLGIKIAKQCNDNIDNDGDGKIDMNDAGCANRNDNDETNCGDGVCEGGETSSSCPTDCGTPTTTTIPSTTTTIPNSCSDTDGGIVITVKGTVSGYSSGSPYSYTDFCVENSTTSVKEYYCSGNNWYSYSYSCAGNVTTTCVDGACV